MDYDVENFIKENINLIQSQNWDEVYKKDFPDGFTETLLDCGINPLEQGLNYIPGYFLHKSNIKEFTIPDNITSIGYAASYECSKLTSIVIPESVKSIDTNAFANCTSLTNIEIPNGVTIVERAVFWGCSSLTSVVIPNSVISLGVNAFYKCSSLTNINYVGTIDEWVSIDFGNYYSNPTYYTKDLYINNTLVTKANITTATKINTGAFYNCTSLKSVMIGDNVTSIGEWAFSHCNNLTSIEMSNSVTSIGNYAFLDCKSLTKINYLGTKKEAMQLGIGNRSRKRWREGSAISKIICTDGVIEL